MKGLFFDIKKMLSESLTVFTHNPMNGKRDISIWGVICYIIVPITIGIGAAYCRYVLGNDMRASIIPILTLFMALVFQVIYIAADKFAKRVNRKVKDNRLEDGQNEAVLHDDAKNYLLRFENYTKLFIRQLILILLISLLIIVCYILIHLDIRLLNVALSSLIIVLLYLWLLLMLKAIVSIYTLLMDDIKEQHKKIR